MSLLSATLPMLRTSEADGSRSRGGGRVASSLPMILASLDIADEASWGGAIVWPPFPCTSTSKFWYACTRPLCYSAAGLSIKCPTLTHQYAEYCCVK